MFDNNLKKSMKIKKIKIFILREKKKSSTAVSSSRSSLNSTTSSKFKPKSSTRGNNKLDKAIFLLQLIYCPIFAACLLGFV